MFLDTRAAFDSVPRSALWVCVLRKEVPGKCFHSEGSLSANLGKCECMGNFSRPILSPVLFGAISLLLLNVVVNELLCKILDGVANRRVDFSSGPRNADLNHVDDDFLMEGDPRAVQAALNPSAAEVTVYGMNFAPSKCRMFFQGWQGDLPGLTLWRKHLKIVKSFVYLRNYVSGGRHVEDKIPLHIFKARLAFFNIRQL